MLSITSVGLLVFCDCKTTSAFEYDNYGALPKIEVEYTGSSTTLYVADYLYDSVSNACGDGTGLTYCGTRSFLIFDAATGALLTPTTPLV